MVDNNKNGKSASDFEYIMNTYRKPASRFCCLYSASVKTGMRPSECIPRRFKGLHRFADIGDENKTSTTEPQLAIGLMNKKTADAGFASSRHEVGRASVHDTHGIGCSDVFAVGAVALCRCAAPVPSPTSMGWCC